MKILSTENNFYKLLYGALFLYVIAFILFDYSRVAMHNEYPTLFMKQILAAGDVLNGLNRHNIFFLDYARPRPISFICMILNQYFRVWFFHFLPPHPSLSIMWLLIFGLTPFFLYKLTVQLTNSSKAAWATLLIFMVSPGSLGSATLLFHPGKPLALFFLILLMYMGGKLVVSRPVNRTLEFTFYSILLLAFFSDETTWVLVLLLPTFYSSFIQKYRFRTGLLFSFIIFIGLVTFAVPNSKLGNPQNFWASTTTDNYILRGALSVPVLLPWNAIRNTYYLSKSVLYPLDSGAWGILVTLTFVAWLLFQYSRQDSASKKFVKRSLIAILFFILFETIILTRHLGIILSPFHYGAFFSLLTALPIGLLLSSPAPRTPGLHYVMIIGFLSLTLHNFLAINHSWVTAQYHVSGQERPMLSRELISKLWKVRTDAELIDKHLAPLAGGGDWLQEELKNIK